MIAVKIILPPSSGALIDVRGLKEMDRAHEYLLEAALAEQAAAAVSLESAKKRLFEIAQRWRRLAEQARLDDLNEADKYIHSNLQRKQGMTADEARNVNSGRRVAESTFDQGPRVRRADGDPDAHFEADPDQIVKIVHEDRPSTIPEQGPIEFKPLGESRTPGASDAAVVPTETSVWEASPPEEGAD